MKNILENKRVKCECCSVFDLGLIVTSRHPPQKQYDFKYSSGNLTIINCKNVEQFGLTFCEIKHRYTHILYRSVKLFVQ
jgi:hypothetical protein